MQIKNDLRIRTNAEDANCLFDECNEPRTVFNCTDNEPRQRASFRSQVKGTRVQWECDGKRCRGGVAGVKDPSVRWVLQRF